MLDSVEFDFWEFIIYFLFILETAQTKGKELDKATKEAKTLKKDLDLKEKELEKLKKDLERYQKLEQEKVKLNKSVSIYWGRTQWTFRILMVFSFCSQLDDKTKKVTELESKLKSLEDKAKENEKQLTTKEDQIQKLENKVYIKLL